MITASTGSSSVSSMTWETNSTPLRCAATGSPANTPQIGRAPGAPRPSATSTRKSWRARRAISSNSRCSGLSSIDPSEARVSRINLGLCRTLMVSCAASPGAISLRPPEKPSIRCGSMNPRVMCSSADTKRSSTYTGVPDCVAPRCRCSASLRAS